MIGSAKRSQSVLNCEYNEKKDKLREFRLLLLFAAGRQCGVFQKRYKSGVRSQRDFRGSDAIY
jgi:hypothetical protein